MVRHTCRKSNLTSVCWFVRSGLLLAVSHHKCFFVKCCKSEIIESGCPSCAVEHWYCVHYNFLLIHWPMITESYPWIRRCFKKCLQSSRLPPRQYADIFEYGCEIRWERERESCLQILKTICMKTFTWIFPKLFLKFLRSFNIFFTSYLQLSKARDFEHLMFLKCCDSFFCCCKKALFPNPVCTSGLLHLLVLPWQNSFKPFVYKVIR